MTVLKGQRQLSILLIIWKTLLEPGNNCPFKIQKIQLMKFNEKAVEHIPLCVPHPPSLPPHPLEKVSFNHQAGLHLGSFILIKISV